MQMDEFVNAVERLAIEAGKSASDEPQPWEEPCLPDDRKFEGATENFNAERAGSVRTSDYMGSAPFQPDRECFDYREKNAVIVVARIGIEKAESVQHGHPVVVSLVIANRFGRVICVRGPDEKMINYHVPVGTEMLAATCDQRDLRRKLIYYMGRDGYLVGFNLNWLLTALDFVVPAFRVVDLAVEPAYQRLVQQLAGPDPNYEGLFNVPQRIGFDRRWPAVLFERGIQYYEAKERLYLPRSLLHGVDMADRGHPHRQLVVQTRSLSPESSVRHRVWRLCGGGGSRMAARSSRLLHSVRQRPEPARSEDHRDIPCDRQAR